jgi:hypothetical protein
VTASADPPFPAAPPLASSVSDDVSVERPAQAAASETTTPVRPDHLPAISRQGGSTVCTDQVFIPAPPEAGDEWSTGRQHGCPGLELEGDSSFARVVGACLRICSRARVSTNVPQRSSELDAPDARGQRCSTSTVPTTRRPRGRQLTAASRGRTCDLPRKAPPSCVAAVRTPPSLCTGSAACARRLLSSTRTKLSPWTPTARLMDPMDPVEPRGGACGPGRRLPARPCRVRSLHIGSRTKTRFSARVVLVRAHLGDVTKITEAGGGKTMRVRSTLVRWLQSLTPQGGNTGGNATSGGALRKSREFTDVVCMRI